MSIRPLQRRWQFPVLHSHQPPTAQLSLLDYYFITIKNIWIFHCFVVIIESKNIVHLRTLNKRVLHMAAIQDVGEWGRL